MSRKKAALVKSELDALRQRVTGGEPVWVELITHYGARFPAGSRWRAEHVDPTYGDIAINNGAYLPYDYLRVCDPPKKGDWVVYRGTGTCPYGDDNRFTPMEVADVDPKRQFLYLVNRGSTPFPMTRFEWVDPATYKAPVAKYTVGQSLIVPEANERNIKAYGWAQLINKELRIQSVMYAPSYGRFLYALDDKTGNRLIQNIDLEAYAEGFAPMPPGWEPREIKANWDQLQVDNLSMTTPSFGSCCGARILYNFYCLNPGSGAATVKGNDAHGVPFPHVTVTVDMFKTAVQNYIKASRSTGVILAILATDQIERYGPHLESLGFTKLNEYSNLNHGSGHMNALYGYFVEENQKKVKVKEAKRAFG